MFLNKFNNIVNEILNEVMAPATVFAIRKFTTSKLTDNAYKTIFL